MVMHECGTELTMVSLFDGIGGFPLAGVAAGIRTVATCEIDPAAAGVTADHFPEAKAFTDVTELTADELLAAGFCPGCGVLTGGWPCQDLSLAGRRLGLGGARSGLFFEIVRLARDLRPRWLVLENVPGLLSAVCSCPGLGVCGTGCSDPHPVRGGLCGSRGGRGGRCMELHGGAMGAVLGSLAELGYGLAYRVLDAQHFGVPQRRRRVVLVGCLGDGAAPAQILLEPGGGTGDPAARRRAWAGIAGVADGGTDRSGGVAGPLMSARGWRVGADEAGSGQIQIVNALTSNMAGGGGGVDDNTAQGGHVVAYQQQGSSVGPSGTMRRGNGSVTGGVPFLATTITTREGKGPDSDMTSGNVVGFDAAQITSGENRSNPQPGDPQPPLAARRAPRVAYSLRANPGGVGQGHNTNYVPLGGEVTHALTAEGADASEDGTGRGTPIVAFGHKNSIGPAASEDRANSVRDGGGQGGGAIAFGHANGIDEQASENVTPTLRAGHGVGGGSNPAAAAVRRLTPMECERLQGYPDRWTATSGGREQSDSARYRQLGNSIAVPVFAWVLLRLAAGARG